MAASIMQTRQECYICRLWLKKEAQAAFEARYGHERWMAETGKDYLKCSML